MQQSEILSLVERLIPAYSSDDFDLVFNQIMAGENSSAKLLVKMELNRLMAPCQKRVDLRGRVETVCFEYQLNGLTHWLDDRAFDNYHKLLQKFGDYTEGVWEQLLNKQLLNIKSSDKDNGSKELTDPSSPYAADPIVLGYDLKRKENRLKLESQVSVEFANGDIIAGVSVDLSNSGAKIKVPGTFDYDLGQVIKIHFAALASKSDIAELHEPIEYRILGVDGVHGVSPIKYLRTLRLTQTKAIEMLLESLLDTTFKKTRHNNQDRITRARTRCFEHTYLKHACNLPLFFSGNELKVALLTENNFDLWDYWHDERYQQTLGSLFSAERMEMLVKTGIKGCSNVLYTFSHDHKGMKLFYSMMMPEAEREERQLFWHVGARRSSWKAFRLSVFELSAEDSANISQNYSELVDVAEKLTHFGILQEISDNTSASDYLFTEKPRIPSSSLNRFRHPRQINTQIRGLYFDAQSRRKEPRYQFSSPITVTSGEHLFRGKTLDFSKHGLSIELDSPIPVHTDAEVNIDYLEIKRYNTKLPLEQVPYKVVRMSQDRKVVHLAMVESAQTVKTVAFFHSIIESNRDKLSVKLELLPTPELLESFHNVLLAKMVSTPIFIDKRGTKTKCRSIGVNYPLPSFVRLLEKLGHGQQIALDPIFKGRSNTLIADPTKRRSGAKAYYQELYIGALKLGERIQSVHTKLRSDFETTQGRIKFIKDALNMGELYILRVSTSPVFDALTMLMKEDINELLTLSMSHARNLENEMSAIIGYCEVVDITEEVLVRLEINH